jgi:hypothetical protein
MKSINKCIIQAARQKLHENLKGSLLKTDKTGIPSIADKDSKPSVAFAKGIFDRLKVNEGPREIAQINGFIRIQQQPLYSARKRFLQVDLKK